MNNLEWIGHIPYLGRATNKYSQTGEEIILRHIFEHLGVTNRYLVDFGAGDGVKLSNSKLLLENGWTGLLMDGDNQGNPDVKQEFITPENIVALFKKYEVPPDFDLLSIDLDSCDFHLLIQVLNNYRPRVICCEYNPAFYPGESKYLKYEEGYVSDCTTKYGFSFAAGRKLMNKYGYSLIHNQDFLNLFFIHNAILGKLDIEVPDERRIFHPFNENVEWLDY